MKVKAILGFALVMILAAASSLWANSPPQVSDVEAVPRQDGSTLVNVYYTLNDNDGDLCDITLQLSGDMGQTWPMELCRDESYAYGDVLQVSSGRRHLTWDSNYDFPGVCEPNVMIRVTADDYYGGDSLPGQHTGSGASNEFSIANCVAGELPVVTRISSQHVKPEKKTYFLKGVSLEEEFIAEIEWNGYETGQTQVVWYRNSAIIAIDDTRAETVARIFNVGADFEIGDHLYAQAVVDGEIVSDKLQAEFEVVDTPPGLLPGLLRIEDDKYQSNPFNIDLPEFQKYPPPTEDRTDLAKNAQVEFKSSVELVAQTDFEGHCEIKPTSGHLLFSSEDFKIAQLDVGAEASGALVIAFDYGGGAWKPSGTLEITSNAAYASDPYYINVPVGSMSVPVYFRCTAQTEASVDCQINQGPDQELWFQGQAPIGAGLKASVGINWAKRLAGELALRGALNFAFDIAPEVSLNEWSLMCEVGVRLAALSYNLQESWELFEWPDGEGGLLPPTIQLSAADFAPMARDYLAGDYALWHGDQTDAIGLTNGDPCDPCGPPEEIVLQSNVFDYSDPTLAVSGDVVCLAWRYDEPSRSDLDSTMLVYSLSQMSPWSAPLPVADDGTADFAPSSAIHVDGRFLIAWANVSEMLADGTDLYGMADKLDIEMATFDPCSMGWIAETVTSAPGMDFAPKIVGDTDGKVTVVWVHDDNSDWLGEMPPMTNHLMARTKTPADWGPEQVLDTVSGMILGVDIEVTGPFRHVVYSVDADGDLSTIHDTELFYINDVSGAWSLPQQLTSDSHGDTNPQLVRTSSELLLIWNRDNTIVCTNDITGMTNLTDAAPTTGEFAATVTVMDQVSVIWPGPSAAGSDIYMATRNPMTGAWSSPVQVSDDPGMERSIAAAGTFDENVVMAYNKLEIIDEEEGPGAFGQADLCVRAYQLGVDIAPIFDRVHIDDPNAGPGDTVNLLATIANYGDVGADDVPIIFCVGDSPEPINQVGDWMIIDHLPAGGEATVSFPWTIPDIQESLQVWIFPYPEMPVFDRNPENNFVAKHLFGPNASFGDVSVRYGISDSYSVAVEIVNTGMSSIHHVECVLYTEDGHRAVDWRWVDNLPPGQSRTVVFRTSSEQIHYGHTTLRLVLDPFSDLWNEASKNDNMRTVLIDNTMPYDIAVNGFIDLVDLSVLADHWLVADFGTIADIAPHSGDGMVDMQDYAVLAAHWQEHIREVPDVFGMNLLQAEMAIRSAGMLIDRFEEQHHGFVPMGNVVWQNPPGWTMVFDVDTVQLGISKGPAIDDDFESGDLFLNPWMHPSESWWHVVGGMGYESEFAVRSGEIPDGGESTLEVTLPIESDSIGFFVRTSSQLGDELLFFIDGEHVDSWSGELDWQEVFYPVGSGMHTFTWTYRKDEVGGDGQDCGWIDDFRQVIDIPVPDVIGLAQLDAEATINLAGLTVRMIHNQWREDVPAGIICDQWPASGMLLRPGDEVELFISLGSIGDNVPEIEWAYIEDPGVDDDGDGIPEHPSFCGEMSTHEITNAQYCQFLNTALITSNVKVMLGDVYGDNGPYETQKLYELNPADDSANIGYDGAAFTVKVREGVDMSDHPVTNVTAYGADAFAFYYGWRLPTEWEWQAVADFDGTYTYGCGATLDPNLANWCRPNPLEISDARLQTTPVGYYGPYGYGMYDMGGNVSEWVIRESEGGTSPYIACDLSHFDECVEKPVGQRSDPNADDAEYYRGFRVVAGSEPGEVYAPNVIGLPLAEAEAALTEACLAVGMISHEWHESIPEGHIADQNPLGGMPMSPWAEVDLVVSLGQQAGIEVPDLTGYTQAEVEGAFAAIGLVVGDIIEQPHPMIPAGHVLNQDPAPGATVPDGTAVDLVISSGPPQTEPQIEWVFVDDPGVDEDGDGTPDHEGFTGEMGKYEVTNGQFCAFLNAALLSIDIAVQDGVVQGANGFYDGAPMYDMSNPYAQITFVNDTFIVGSRDGYSMADHPVTAASWYGAAAFAAYYGWRLPTEWEWQAVADYDGSYIFGCGFSANHSKANIYVNGPANPLGLTAQPYTSPVGYYGLFGYGLCDMTGNVPEWTDSWIITDSEYRVVRDSLSCTTVDWHAVNSPDSFENGIGFRVCRDAAGEGIAVPLLIGMTQAEAEAALADAGLGVGNIYEQAQETISAGEVLNQHPFAGTILNEGTAVDLAVSKGAFDPNELGIELVYVADPGVDVDGDGRADHEGFLGEVGKYEITNAQYCQFLNEMIAADLVYYQVSSESGRYGKIRAVDGPYEDELLYQLNASDQIEYTGVAFTVRSYDGHSMADYPVSFVTWYGASAFCDRYGYRLPTQWEWRAVADYDGSYVYGCGPEIDLSIANYDYSNPLGLTQPPYTPYTTPVGYYGDFGYGLSDMAGNVMEWTSSLDENSRYEEIHVVGGYYGSAAMRCEVGYLLSFDRLNDRSELGFRVWLADEQDIVVPNLIGLSQGEAELVLAQAWLTVGTVTVQPHPTIPAGDVCDQSLDAGTPVSAWTIVDMVVSTGPMVPNVIGMSQAAAEQIIADAGLVVGNVTEAPHDTVPAGEVIDQSPVADTPASAGSEVNLVVSNGPAMVPDVVGMSQEEAEQAITLAGLVVGTVTHQPHVIIPPGEVISQDPEAGLPMLVSSEVDLVISAGPEVPNVIGWSQSEAEAAIEAAGLVMGVITEQPHASVPAGDVIEQDPDGGTSVAAGTAVDLVISVGPMVPDVIGMSQAAAGTAILNAGLIVGSVTTECSNTVPAGQVISQDPAAGELLLPEGSVDLVVSLGPDITWVYINDDGSGMIDQHGYPIDYWGGFTGEMSKYETTNAQYCQYLNAALASGDITVSNDIVYGADGSNRGGDFVGEPYFDTYAADSDSQITYSGGVFSVRSRDGYSMFNHPVVEVSWYGATAFAEYYGWRLPTQWEWQAVADYDGSFTYGCGMTIDPSKANYAWNNPLNLTSHPYTSPVDYYPSYGYGLNDLAGNVWEWTSSLYGYSASLRVSRGGNEWSGNLVRYTVWYGHSYGEMYSTLDYTGFRVCRSASGDVSVPLVMGMTQAEAEAAIVAAGLTVGNISVQMHDTIPQGEVLDQDPASGSPVPPGTAIDLVVSSGPSQIAQIEWVAVNDEGFTGEMSRYEVTNGQYCEFLNAALASGDAAIVNGRVEGANGFYGGDVFYDPALASAQIVYADGQFRIIARDGYDMVNFPVANVSWYGAAAFCDYYGWRLPTEWEWQAVADYDGSFVYGCGTTIDATKANYNDANPLELTQFPYTVPTGHYPTQGYGMCDMAGNLWEWTSSWYSDNQEYRVLRGGCWMNNESGCTVAARHFNNPGDSVINYGFRVCR